jgi:diaminopimelate decarboxylase
MLGFFKKRLRKAVARGLDYHNRNIAQTHLRKFDPALWGLNRDGSGALALGSHTLDALANEYATPLHVLHTEQLEADYHHFVGSARRVHPRTTLAYSYKTNPVPAALQVLHRAGAFAEVISHFELWLALHLQVPPSEIVFNGPGKSVESLELAVSRNIFMINVGRLVRPVRPAARERHGP